MCGVCSFATAAITLAVTDKALEKALSAYKAHLLRAHGMTAAEAEKNVEAARTLAGREVRE